MLVRKPSSRKRAAKEVAGRAAPSTVSKKPRTTKGKVAHVFKLGAEEYEVIIETRNYHMVEMRVNSC